MDKSPLREPAPGEPITAEWAAELTKRVAEQGIQAESFGDDYSRATDQKRRPSLPASVWVLNGTGAEIAPYSIFGVAGNLTNTSLQEPALVGGGETVNQGCLFGLLTNGSLAIPSGGTAECQPVDGLGAFRVKMADDPTPKVGYPCGPHPDEQQFNMEYTGFTVLTARDSETGTCMVAATALLTSCYVELTSELPAASTDDDVNIVMGQGTARIYYRKQEDNSLHPLTDPVAGVAFAEFIVFNPWPHVIPNGYRTQASCRVGCGICIDSFTPETELTYAMPSSAGGMWTDENSEDIYVIGPTSGTEDGFLYFNSRAGSEVAVGISHDPLLSCPTPGNFTCTREGQYQITLTASFDLIANVLIDYTADTSNEVPDAGFGQHHHHTYNDSKGNISGPVLHVALCDGSGSGFNFLEDEFGGQFNYAQGLPQWQHGQPWTFTYMKTTQILEGATFHLKVRIVGAMNTLKLSLIRRCVQLHFRRIGDSKAVESTTGS